MSALCFKQPACAATLIRDAEQGFNYQGPELQCFKKSVDLQFRCEICHDILPLEINNTFFRTIHLF